MEKPELVTKKRPEKSTKGHKKTWKVHNREQKKTRKITVGHKKKTEERLGTGERLGTLERKIGKIKRELKKKRLERSQRVAKRTGSPQWGTKTKEGILTGHSRQTGITTTGHKTKTVKPQ